MRYVLLHLVEFDEEGHREDFLAEVALIERPLQHDLIQVLEC